MTAYVLKMYPRFSETFILQEILELERRGRPIRIVALKKPDDGRFHEDLARVGAAVTYLPEHVRSAPLRFAAAHARALSSSPARWLCGAARALTFGPHAWGAFARAPLVAEAVAGCGRMHAHFATLPAVTAMFASSLSGVPYSFTCHAKDIYLNGRPRRLLRALMRSARRVVTVSDFNVAHLRRTLGAGVDQPRVVRIYNGVDLAAFAPSQEALHGVPEILAIGRLVEKKGFGLLVLACARLRDQGVPFRCAIVGKGPEEHALRAAIDRHDLGDRVTLAGALSRRAVAERLSRATVLAVPCVVGRDGNRDGMPTVILEAMASGVPVVATDVTGIPEAIVDRVTGRVVAESDPPAFADALLALLRDPAACADYGRAARRRAEDLFDAARNVATLDAVLHEESESPLPADTVSTPSPVQALR